MSPKTQFELTTLLPPWRSKLRGQPGCPRARDETPGDRISVARADRLVDPRGRCRDAIVERSRRASCVV